MLRTKLPKQPASIFTVMSSLAQENNAINLSQGFPEFNPPLALLEKVKEALEGGKNQYAPMPGILSLREILSMRIAQWRGFQANPITEITIVPGATAGLFVCIQALVHPGDEVILFDPSYDSYAPAVILAGGRPIRIALNPADFSMPWDRIEELINHKTKLILINTPHNPMGRIFSREDWDQLANLLSNSDAMVLSDEVYEHMVFDPYKHISVLEIPSLSNRSIAISSFGKTFHATGWKLGYICASETITTEIRKVYQFMAFSANTPMQWAAAEFMCEYPNYESSVKTLLQEKRDIFANAMRSSRFTLLPCDGAYFQIVEYSAISGLNDMEFAKEITTKHKVAGIPVSAFYQTSPPDQKLLRFCFAKHADTLLKSAEILCRL
ncbi:MAG: aminotransferase [Flavobacteriales bacterium]|nr:MAG: aminotransferase [Flavobacteriales bacterium]PHX91897.1 MAG: aminotransferase [Flavobacteriales bacterium]